MLDSAVAGAGLLLGLCGFFLGLRRRWQRGRIRGPLKTPWLEAPTPVHAGSYREEPPEPAPPERAPLSAAQIARFSIVPTLVALFVFAPPLALLLLAPEPSELALPLGVNAAFGFVIGGAQAWIGLREGYKPQGEKLEYRWPPYLAPLWVVGFYYFWLVGLAPLIIVVGYLLRHD